MVVSSEQPDSTQLKQRTSAFFCGGGGAPAHQCDPLCNCAVHFPPRAPTYLDLPVTSYLPAAVDASDDSFRFYSGGVYHNPGCHTAPADLDHAVIVRWGSWGELRRGRGAA